MPFLAYRNLPMSIIHAREIGRRAILSRDNTTFHFWEWVFDVDAVYNPMATSYSMFGQVSNVSQFVNGRISQLPIAATNINNLGGQTPTQQPGMFPVFTDAALRHYLSQPWGRLVYAVENPDDPQRPVVLLNTPWANYNSDASVGPNVERCDILQLHGSRSFLVSLRIVARVNESARNVTVNGVGNGGFPVLLSHRYRQYVDQDTDFFATRVTEGEATFRVDELDARGLVPDNFLGYLAPPLPDGFRREPCQRLVSEDRSSMTYRFVDRELPINVPAAAGRRSGCTRVEAVESHTVEDPSFALAVGTAFFGALPSVGSSGVGAAFATTPVGQVAAGVSIAATGLSSLIGVFTSTAKKFIESVRVRVWGHSNSLRFFRNNGGLQSYAVAIGVSRLGPPGVRMNTVATLIHDITAKYVEFVMTHVRMPLAFPDPFDWLVNHSFPVTDSTTAGNGGETFQTGTLLSNAAEANMAPPNSSGARGTWLGSIRAAPLTSFGSLPPGGATVVNNADQTPP